MANQFVKNFQDDNFSAEISKGPTLVDFFAEWCGPCRQMSPVIDKLAQEMQGKLTVAKIDIDSNQQTPSALQVTSIPTLILFVEGKEVKRIIGLKDLESLKKLLAPWVS